MGQAADVVQQAYEAFGRGDIPAVLETVADDVEWNAPGTLPHGGTFNGRDEVGGFFQRLGELWDPITIDIEAVLENGDRAAGVGRATGTRRESGEEVSFGFVHVFTVRDGKVARFREFVDLDAPLG